MDRNEAVHFQKTQELIQEVVRIITNQLKQIVDIFSVQSSYTSSQALGFQDNIASFMPELHYTIPGVTREPTAIENIVEIKQPMFLEPDGSNFDIMANLAVAH